jgi:hypothetical protein
MKKFMILFVGIILILIVLAPDHQSTKHIFESAKHTSGMEFVRAILASGIIFIMIRMFSKKEHHL